MNAFDLIAAWLATSLIAFAAVYGIVRGVIWTLDRLIGWPEDNREN
jgi:hypothetical protein